MKARVVLLLLLPIGIAVFAGVNWNAFTRPTTLSLVVTTIEAPLGLIMLGLVALLTLAFFVFAVVLRTSVLVEAKRHARELQTQRELAENAEVSRYTELRTLIETRLLQVEQRIGQGEAGVLTRLDLLDRDMRSAVEQAGNSLAAYIGEFEDRMEGQHGGQLPKRPV